MIGVSTAIQDWVNLLGQDNVIHDPERLKSICSDTWMNPPSSPAVLKPSSISEIQEILKIANQHRIPIYPISRGMNLGYGAASPAREGSVVLDLSRLNRILEVNVEKAYCVIEPGVTQQDLYDYISKNSLPLICDVSAGPPKSSIMGNILERGMGFNPHADHFETSCGMEVVLANGDIVKTGFGHFKESKTQYLSRYGVGPFIDGLFTQSNLGIVVKMGVWLLPKPESIEMFILKIKNLKDLEVTTEKLRKLKLSGTLHGNVHIFNSDRSAFVINNFEYFMLGRNTHSLKQFLGRKFSVGTWTAIGGLYGSKSQVATHKKEIKKIFGSCAKVAFMNSKIIRTLKTLGKISTKLGQPGFEVAAQFAEESFGLVKGIPSGTPLLGLYSKRSILNKNHEPDPIHESIGFTWCSAVLPFDFESIKLHLDSYKKIFEESELVLQVTLHAHGGRSLYAVTSILFDKLDPEQAKKAAECLRKLLEAGRKNGFLPYRSGIYTFDFLVDPNDPYWQTISRIKDALDPNHILSPGHYSL